MTRQSSSLSDPIPGSLSPSHRKFPCKRLLPIFILLAEATLASAALNAQTANRIPVRIDATQVYALPNHHPQWANSHNDVGLAPQDSFLNQLTLVLSRSTKQEAAFDQFLSDQQNSASPEYHHWLTPAEVGARFGLSDQDMLVIEDWLQEQGMSIGWVSPSRSFIGFSGTAADVGRAFQTDVHTYRVNGVERMSVSSDPMIPRALAPAIKAVHGLYTIDDKPLHFANSMVSGSPEMISTDYRQFITPADFAVIYDLPGGSGGGQTIGIVGRSRINSGDILNFQLKTASYFQTPTEIVPTAFGGIDPGPPFTSPPAAGVSTEDQLEATLDVTRAGSVARGAQLLLVAATSKSGGIEAGAQYLVQTSPVPAQIMTISFGACELAAGPSAVNFWDTLFQQAAAEGISVFVSSGDAGASGCDANFGLPPVNPQPNSPNYICSSSYATCVGGTEFNDTAGPSRYWNTTNGPGLSTAIAYIPEGAWNEPLQGSATRAAASAGGVSSIIATPPWQTGTGVPAVRAGRYTPDIAFSASIQDAYFGCFAADVGDCVNAQDGSYRFETFSGTSAAAPSMAGISALLNARLGAPQGSLNPEMYHLASANPAAFHDVTLATSGVSGCDVTIPSMCNNSIPSATGLTGGRAGYLVTDGYDEVTGLGSLDVAAFLSSFEGPKTTPTILFPGPFGITTAQALSMSLAVNGRSGIPPTGTITFTSGTYTSVATQVNNGMVFFTLAAGALAPGTDTLIAHYTPDTAGTQIYDPASASILVTVTAVPMITPTVTVTPNLSNITLADSLQVMISINGGQTNQAPSGTVTLSSGSYVSGATPAVMGYANVVIPARSLTPGTVTLTANYTPDTASSGIYYGATGAVTIAVSTPPPTFTVSATAVSILSGATTGNTSTVTVTPADGFTGSVVMTAAVTSSPYGAQHPPIVSFGSTSAVAITGTSAGTATLTIGTTQATSAALAYPKRSGIPWYPAGGATLACILAFGIPARRRKWQAILGTLALLVTLSSGMLACGGASGSTTNRAPTGSPGTAAGTYTVTVTGTSGTTTATGRVTLNVR